MGHAKVSSQRNQWPLWLQNQKLYEKQRAMGFFTELLLKRNEETWSFIIFKWLDWSSLPAKLKYSSYNWSGFDGLHDNSANIPSGKGYKQKV